MKTLVVEHKTSSEDIGLGSVYWRRLTLDGQISNYLVGARALGHEPDGVLYDVLRKPALRPYEVNSKRCKPESPEEYRDRCIAAIAEKPDHYYQRGIVVRLESEERDAAFDMWWTAESIRTARSSERWPRNVDACSQYNRMCDYWEVCAGEASIEDPIRFEKGDAHRELDGKHHLPMLTSSSTRTFRACARRYFYAYEMGVRARKSANALQFGKVVHAGLETWLTSGRDLDKAIDAMFYHRKGDAFTDPPYDYDAAKAEAMLRGYHARWADEPLEVVAVEAEFQAPLVNPETGAKSRTFVRAGRIDAIVRHKDV